MNLNCKKNNQKTFLNMAPINQVSDLWKARVKNQWYELRNKDLIPKKPKSVGIIDKDNGEVSTPARVTNESDPQPVKSPIQIRMGVPKITNIPNLPSIRRWIPIGQNFVDDGSEEEERIKILDFEDDVNDNDENNKSDAANKNVEDGNDQNDSKKLKNDEEDDDKGIDIPYFDDFKFMIMVQNLTRLFNRSSGVPRFNAICRMHYVKKHKYDKRSKVVNRRVKPIDVNEIPPNIIFRAISQAFPGTRSANGFRQKYIGLLQINPIFNIDGAYAKDMPPERSFHTMRSLFCRQCLYYDCVLHRHECEHTELVVENKRFSEVETVKEPCENNCFMLLNVSEENRKNSVDTKNTNDEESNSSKLEMTDVNNVFNIIFNATRKVKNGRCIWTGSDRTMFKALSTVFPKNYCAIAQILLTKTCQEVYEFAQNESAVEVTVQENGDSPGKKKKKGKYYKNRGARKIGSSSELAKRYIPCNHPGDCNFNCTCIRNKILCEKFCKCNMACCNRCRGCRCKTLCNTKHCPCFWALRECDPDLCGYCGGPEIDPNNVHCKNVNLQRRLRKPLLWAPSEVAGWGIYVKDAVEKNEFISEYCGELISHYEAERRGIQYAKENCSYLFNLNEAYVIDAYKYGSKMRFANHSNDPNCYAKVLLVNGDHRVGIFAKRDIEAGEELFLDYRYGPTDQLKFIERKNDKES